MSQIFQKMKNCRQESVSGVPHDIHHKRQYHMATLALADESILEAEAARLANFFSYIFLRRPEVGLLMVEGRAGNSGRRFNLGEMLVTRCVVRLVRQGSGNATEGYSFIQGNRPRHAELAALFDALLQQEDLEEYLKYSLIECLVTRRDAKLRKRAEKTAATKVDFFTLARGEDE